MDYSSASRTREAVDTYGSDKTRYPFRYALRGFLRVILRILGFPLSEDSRGWWSREGNETGMKNSLSIWDRLYSQKSRSHMVQEDSPISSMRLMVQNHMIFRISSYGMSLLHSSAKLAPKVRDMIFFGARQTKTTCKVLGQVRLACEIGLTSFSWWASYLLVTDFPIRAKDDELATSSKFQLFSMPHGGVHAFWWQSWSLSIYGCQYDLACNGYEILSGSIRNHSVEALVKAFNVVGKGEEEVKSKFWAMYNRLPVWVPPHGDLVLGSIDFHDPPRRVQYPGSSTLSRNREKPRCQDETLLQHKSVDEVQLQRVAYQGEGDE